MRLNKEKLGEIALSVGYVKSGLRAKLNSKMNILGI